MDAARAVRFEVDGPLNASHPALLGTPRRNDLRRQPMVDSLAVARLLLAKPIEWSGPPELTGFDDRLDTHLERQVVIACKANNEIERIGTIVPHLARKRLNRAERELLS